MITRREDLYLYRAVFNTKPPPFIRDYRIRFLSYYLKQSHKTLLDVSCGKGTFLKYFQWKGLETTGTEINDSYIENIKNSNIPCLKVDLNKSKLPFKDNSFDIVNCTEVIEHIKYPESVVAECVRVSKDLILITTPVGKSYYAPDHINFWNSKDDLKESLKKLIDIHDCEISTIVTKPEDWPMHQRCFIIAIFKN